MAESHLVDLDHVADPVPWERVEAIAAVVGKVAPGSAVTVEPGGQIELSGPPAACVAPAVAQLRYEGTGVRLALADRRLGLAYAGADPARPSPGACRPSSCRRWPTSLILLSRVAVPAICWPSAWARSGHSPHWTR